MIETALFDRLLELSNDWSVTKIDIDNESNSLYVYISYTKTSALHPVSGTEYPIYDFRKERPWQHLPVMPYRTYIRCRIPRIKDAGGKVTSVPVPWSELGEHHTYHFENLSIDILLATHNQTKTASLLRTSFDVINRIMHRAVARGLARRVTVDDEIIELCIDEKSFHCKSGYISVLSDPANRRILDITEGRDTVSAMTLLSGTLTQEQLAKVKNINMDMWIPYMASAEVLMPNAAKTHDKFHVIKYLNDAVDSTRRQEVKKEPALLNSKYSMLKNENKRTEAQQELFENIMSTSLKTANAWALADSFKALFSAKSDAQAYAYLDFWADKVNESKIPQMIKVAKTMLSHAKGIVNNIWFKTTNSIAERLNGKIQTLNVIGRGYRTFANFRSAILFFNGGLDLLSYDSQ